MRDLKLLFYVYGHKIFFWCFILFFVLQIIFWKISEQFKSVFEIVPPAPSHQVLKTLSFGDKEFLFRVLILRFQNSGDILLDSPL